MDEFQLIETVFSQLTHPGSPALGLKDDAAVLHPPSGHDLVFTKDMMVAGRHFFENDVPDLIARKLLRVNLSDLAAMGAEPLGYLLAIAFPDKLDEAFARRLAIGLSQDQKNFGLSLYGGDTVSGAHKLTLSLTAIGHVPQGTAIQRSGAKPGDHIYVSGTIGDAALGLKCLLGELKRIDHLIERYYLPTPRLELGRALRQCATAAIDVSDGLIADIGHICKASGVGAAIQLEAIPLSIEAKNIVEKDQQKQLNAITGGDDYEIAFTIPPSREKEIEKISKNEKISLSYIGTIEKGHEVRLLNKQKDKILIETGGFRHA